MVKLNADMKAGTDAATVTDVQVNHVSQTIAKHSVMRRFVVRLCCGECGNILNETKKMSKEEIHNEWTSLVISSAFASGKCENGCRATFSDCNINTTLKIYDTIDDCYLDKKVFFGRSSNGA